MNLLCDWACLGLKVLRTYFGMIDDAVFVREMEPNALAESQWLLDRRTATSLVRAWEYTYEQ